MAFGVFVFAAVIATLFTQVRLNIEKLGEEPKVGIHLAQGEGFRTPLDESPHAELTAWVPPGYPLVTAAVFRVFGIESPASFRVLIELNAICYGLMVCGVYVIGDMLMGRAVGLIGAALVIADPLFLLLVHRIWDTYLSQAALVWLTVGALQAAKAEPKWIWLAGIGAGLGLLVQFNGSFIFVSPVLVWMAVRDVPFRRWIPLAAVSGLVFTFMLIPWTVRNYLQFHQIMYVRRGAELEMYLGNMPQSTGWQDLRYHPMVYLPERAKMMSMGESKYFAYCQQRFLENYHADPAAYWRRTARRAMLLVIGEPNSRPMEWASAGAWAGRARLVSDVLIFGLGVAGLISAFVLGYRVGWIVPWSIASVVPYLISHMNYRFSMQVKLFLLLMVGFLIWAVWRRMRDGNWPVFIRH
jgi:4-amino-4-deoxy-L-arabinose transferase-like glycosyltransferase